jgi:hypothetical protein
MAPSQITVGFHSFPIAFHRLMDAKRFCEIVDGKVNWRNRDLEGAVYGADRAIVADALRRLGSKHGPWALEYYRFAKCV